MSLRVHSTHSYKRSSEIEVKNRMADSSVATVTAIAVDHLHRMKNCVSDPKLFWGGVFYGDEYFLKSQEAGFTQQPNFNVESGIFFHGFAPPSCFEMIPDSDPTSTTGIKPWTFVLKKGVTPSEGLRKIQEGPSFLDCCTVCQIGYYQALKEVLDSDEQESEKFDTLFSASGPNRLVIGGGLKNNPLWSLFSGVALSKKIVKGQRVYFRNIPTYLKKNPMGPFQGDQTLCCDATPGRERFITIGFPSRGLMRREVVYKQINNYNEEPRKPVFLRREIAEKTQTALAENESQIKDNIEWTIPLSEEGRKSFEKKGGGKIETVADWVMSRVMLLIKATPKEGRILLNGWFEETRCLERLFEKTSRLAKK